MNVNFYICTDDRRKVNKSISTVNTINCNIKERCSLDSPVLIIAKENFRNWKDANYCYISEYGRFYYIENVIVETATRIEIHCKCDVLMSFASNIRALMGVITRQENIYNDFISDNKAPIRAERIISYHQVGNVNGTSILLTVNGG